jgi:predicted HicB family RNase H-like nuclease
MQTKETKSRQSFKQFQIRLSKRDDLRTWAQEQADKAGLRLGTWVNSVLMRLKQEELKIS